MSSHEGRSSFALEFFHQEFFFCLLSDLRTWWTVWERWSSSRRSSSLSSSWSTAPSASSTGCGRRPLGTGRSWSGLCSWWPASWWSSPSASCPAPWPGWSYWSPVYRRRARSPRTKQPWPSTAWWSCHTWTVSWTRWSTASAAPSLKLYTSPTTSPSWSKTLSHQ